MTTINPAPPPLFPQPDIERLREALASASYTDSGIGERIGDAAVRAVRRNDLRGLLRATTGGDRLDTLIRVFLAGQTEAEKLVRAALAPLSLDSALAAGLVQAHDHGYRAGLDLDVYAQPGARPADGSARRQWWLLSDLDAQRRPGPLHPDHVLGVGNATTTLADAVIRKPVGSALDLGTGCGVQALALSRHAGAVTATDLSERALRFAATNAALNEVDLDLRHGDLLEPVAGQRFDLVVSNPPFVVGPGSTVYTYRDSGRAGDRVCAELAASAATLLTPGGTMQFLANWLHVAGEDWRERVRGWVAGTGCDAWILQREVSDPVEYVNLWLQDADETADAGYDPARAEEWLDWFDATKIEAVGFGLVTLRRTENPDPVVRVQELRHQVNDPMGAWVGTWFDRQDWLRAHPGAALLAQRYRRAPGLRLVQEASHDDADWSVDRQILRLESGPRWSEEVDPVALAVVSGADGTVSLRDQLSVLATAFDTAEPVLAAMAVPVVAHLIEQGVLEPVHGSAGATGKGATDGAAGYGVPGPGF